MTFTRSTGRRVLRCSVLPILLGVMLSGCPGRPCPSHPFTDPVQMLSNYRDMRRPLRVLRAEARIDRRGSEGRIRGTVLMFIERPEQVRFDAMTQFGPAAILTSDGARFALTDLRENRFLSGPTCPANIERLLGIRLGGEEVARILLGESPRIDAETTEMVCHDGGYLVTLRHADGGRQELWYRVRVQDLQVEPDDQQLRLHRSSTWDSNDTLMWQVTYDDYRVVADPEDTQTPARGIAMPFSVHFVDPIQGADTMVRFEEIELNVEVSAEVFTQRTRPGLQASEVSCP